MLIVGEIRAFGFGAHSTGFTEAVKKGWIPCDGRSLAIRLYEDLFKVIDVTWGAEIPGTNFCVPNYFGSFLRGASLWTAETKDPDASLRESPRPDLPLQGNTGANVGSFQNSDYSSHSHTGRGKGQGGYASKNGLALTAVAGGPSDTTFSMTDEGGNETRPSNHYVMYMIYAGQNTPVDEVEKMLSEYTADSTNSDSNEIEK